MKFRFGLRPQLVLLFTIAFTLVYLAIFYRVYVFITEHTTKQIRDDLNATLLGTAKGIDGDDTIGLFKEGTATADGFSDDPRYKKQMAYLKQVHELEPRAFPYTMVRGAGSHEYVYVVDVDTNDTKHAAFLEHDTHTLRRWPERRVVHGDGEVTA